MYLKALLAVVPLLIAPAAANAQVAGTWRVNGAIAGRTFVVDCNLAQGGTCTEADGKRRRQPLTAFSTAQDRVSWAFQAKVMLMSITLNFSGQATGDRMSGTLRAAGRNGTFTAQRR